MKDEYIALLYLLLHPKVFRIIFWCLHYDPLILFIIHTYKYIYFTLLSMVICFVLFCFVLFWVGKWFIFSFVLHSSTHLLSFYLQILTRNGNLKESKHVRKQSSYLYFLGSCFWERKNSALVMRNMEYSKIGKICTHTHPLQFGLSLIGFAKMWSRIGPSSSLWRFPKIPLSGSHIFCISCLILHLFPWFVKERLLVI